MLGLVCRMYTNFEQEFSMHILFSVSISDFQYYQRSVNSMIMTYFQKYTDRLVKHDDWKLFTSGQGLIYIAHIAHVVEL